MTNKELIKTIAGDRFSYSMYDEMMKHNYHPNAPVLHPEQRDYDQRVLNAHALLIQHYIDISFGSVDVYDQYDIEVVVQRKRNDRQTKTSP